MIFKLWRLMRQKTVHTEKSIDIMKDIIYLSFLLVVFYGLYQTDFSSHNHSTSSSSEPDIEKQKVIIGCSQQCDDTEGDIRQACFAACIQRNSQ